MRAKGRKDLNHTPPFTIIILVIISLFLLNCDSKKISYPAVDQGNAPYLLVDTTEVKNIIFLIGDGMGIAHITASRVNSRGADGRLHMERMPVTGLISTHSLNYLVTDSAAAGTAMATGYKTNNGVVSLNAKGEKLLTILEACQEKGKSTGLIATSRITHATPAAFATHVISRDHEEEIAHQLIRSGVNVLMGGGRDFFLPLKESGGVREDNRNLITEAQNLGYTVAETAEQMIGTSADKLLGLFELSALIPGEGEPSLAEMTKKALQLLNRNQDGFFLMVEGSQIDWSAHDNEDHEMMLRLLLFDEAVKAVLTFAQQEEGTLVIVTGDHETGGLSLVNGTLDGKKINLNWATTNHTAVLLPVFTFGPGAMKFTGVHDNTEIPKILAGLLDIKNFPRIIKDSTPQKNN